MKIELENRTKYRDDDLRGLVKAACKAAGVRCRTLVLHVATRRSSGRHGGRANCVPDVRARWQRAFMWLYPVDPSKPIFGERDDLNRFKLVILHEAMHLAGATHATMTEDQRDCTGPVPAWAADLPLRLKEEKPAEELVAAARADRLVHARAMLAKAGTRRKRAETIEARWQRRVRAMERARG